MVDQWGIKKVVQLAAMLDYTSVDQLVVNWAFLLVENSGNLLEKLKVRMREVEMAVYWA
jgi:hypothetical protein